jgi:gamma-butyrobetaine dioxygenase
MSMGNIASEAAAETTSRAAGSKSRPDAFSISAATGSDRNIDILWQDGHRSRYPAFWLRDNCRCSQCGDPAIGKRRLRVAALSPDTVPATLTVTADGDLTVEWAPEHHLSRYAAAWLRSHSLSKSDRQARRHRPTLWDGSIGRHLPQADAAAVSAAPQARLELYRHLRDHGIAILRNLPPALGELEKFAALFGPLVETNFGRVFEIIWTPDQKSIANSTDPLMPHTDEPYRYTPPGIMLFHCIDASSDGGGVSVFVDGFAVAEALRQAHPGMFELLSRVRVPFRRHYAGEVDVQTAAPLISTDAEGNLQGVRFNDRVMAPLDLDAGEIESFYEAFRTLSGLYYDEKSWCRVPLEAGDLMLFDNHRVLHGRTAFSADIRRRHLRQCHVDRTEFHSRLRVLARSLGDEEADLQLATGSHA